MMILVVGSLAIVIGLLNFAIARDKTLWVSYAVESFRYCSAMGFTMLGARFIWMHFFGDEVGVSLWGGCSIFVICVGQLGLQMNNLSRNTMHIPKFIRKAIE